jgi:hypothetical protein
LRRPQTVCRLPAPLPFTASCPVRWSRNSPACFAVRACRRKWQRNSFSKCSSTNVSWLILRSVDLRIPQAVLAGLLVAIVGFKLTTRRTLGAGSGPRLIRGRSDNFGHADWLSIREASRLFPGPDPSYGGIVVGEAYRVDQDRVARWAFDPADRRSWGQGGTLPLLVDSCRTGSTHALVFAGPGGFKTTSVGIPTMLTADSDEAAVVLDPSREIGPMVQGFRQSLGHQVVPLDPADPAAGAFNVLDWIDTASPEAETNIEAVVNWICGETRGQVTSGAEFFRDSGKGLIAWASSSRPAMPVANTASPSCCSTSRSAGSLASGAARASRPGTTPRPGACSPLCRTLIPPGNSPPCAANMVSSPPHAATAPAARAAVPDLAPVPPAGRRTARRTFRQVSR